MNKQQNQSSQEHNKIVSSSRGRRRPNPFRANKSSEDNTQSNLASSQQTRKSQNDPSDRATKPTNNERREDRQNSTNSRNKNLNRRPTNQNRSGGNAGRARCARRPKIDTTLPADMRTAILENERVQQERMNPWKQIDMGAKGKLRFTPLGGLGEIGGNIAVLESEKDAIIIDVGMSFPDETMHGVDILVPDFSYLHAIKDKIRAIVITHAHEDHIGAVPYLFKELKFPIYGTPLALAMIGNKFDEHGLQVDKKYFRYVVKREIYEIGEFKIEWMHMTHSIIDACSLAIQTPIGTLIHTADFKIDHTPIDGYTADLHRFAYYGSKGVLCLFSDSTNSHNPGFTKSEAVVGKTFDQLFEMAKGRVIMSTFSSNAHRIFQAIERGVEHGRKICIIGRSMERNIETVRRLGYIDVDDRHFIEAHEVGKYKDNEILVVTTGSQGETMAALSRMATDEHRHIKLKPTDTVIISASAIPGNEGSVSKLLNLLLKAGVTVRYKECSDIHVSGHASQEEQKLMVRLVQPKFFLPVHGEYNHIAAHARTAISCGIDERNILLMSDGDQIEITTKYIKKVKTVKSGKRYIDNQNNKEIYADVVDDRQKLSTEGVVNIVVKISTQNGKMAERPIVTSFGLVPDREDKSFSKEIEQVIESYLYSNNIDPTISSKVIEDDLRGAVRKHILRRYKKYPIIIPTVFLV